MAQQRPRSTREDAQVGEVFLQEWVELRLDGRAHGREDRRSQAISRRAAPERRCKGQDGAFGHLTPAACGWRGHGGSPGDNEIHVSMLESH